MELLESVRADVIAGRSLPAALLAVIDDVADPPLTAALAPAAEALRSGRDVLVALQASARIDGGRALGWLASTWSLAETVGAAPAPMLQQLAATGRSQIELQREIAAQLAAPRATARLLATLPVVGLAMGQLLGASPVSVLVGSPAGWGCAAVGVGLLFAGLRWTERLARDAARP